MRKSKVKSEISWPIFGLIVGVATYLSATTTILFMEERLYDVSAKLGLIAMAVLVFMTIMFILSRVAGRTDVVDAAWGLAFIVAALSAYVINGAVFAVDSIQSLTLVLVVVWGTRLAYTISRRLLSHPEDKRYVDLRNQWKGNEMLNTYGRIFVTQAALATLISIGVIHIMIAPEQPIGMIGVIGAAIWALGFIFESVGDYQLKRFLADKKNKGKLMTEGLWRYTRHPNYFGESTMWWGVFVIALSTPYGWVAIITPAIITFLLLFVSGVPMTEKAFEGRKGWKEYKQKTSIFLPLPPK